MTGNWETRTVKGIGMAGGNSIAKRERRRQEESLFLSSEDKADGFSIATDKGNNITLLRRNEPVAWFSVAVSREGLKGFLEVVKYFEKRENG